MKYIVGAMTLLLACVGCSGKSVYEGVQARNRNQCYSLPPSQKEECLQRENKSYEEYERDRQEILSE